MGAKYSKTVTMDEGITWVACNPTPGTGINYTAVATFSTVAAMFTWQNLASTGGKTIIPDKIRLITTTIPTMTQTGLLQCSVVLDSTSRAPSAGNSTITPVGAYSGAPSTVSSIAMFNVFNANQMTVPSWSATAPNRRVVGRGSVPVSVASVGDQIVFNFGSDSDSAASSPLTAARLGGVPSNFVVNLPQCAIAPGHFCVFHLWMPGSAATTIPAYEYEVTWWEV